MVVAGLLNVIKQGSLLLILVGFLLHQVAEAFILGPHLEARTIRPASLPTLAVTQTVPLDHEVPTATTLRHLCDQYECFVVDGFGTLHDGSRAFPGVQEALVRLQEHGKQIVVVSSRWNSRREEVRELERMGISGMLSSEFDQAIVCPGIRMVSILTKGGILARLLAGSIPPSLMWKAPHPSTLRRPFFIARRDVASSYSTRTKTIEDASCIVVDPEFIPTRTPDDLGENESLWGMLERAAELRLPMIMVESDSVWPSTCSRNRDFVAKEAMIETFYKRRACTVFRLGKSFAIATATEISLSIPPVRTVAYANGIDDDGDEPVQYEDDYDYDGTCPYERNMSCVCIIGDALDRDIAAAGDLGLSSVLVSTGVHQDELKKHSTLTVRAVSPSKISHRLRYPSEKKDITEMFESIEPTGTVRPKYFLPRFSWWD